VPSAFWGGAEAKVAGIKASTPKASLKQGALSGLLYAGAFYGAQASNYLHLAITAIVLDKGTYGAFGAIMGAAYLSAALATAFQLHAAAVSRGSSHPMRPIRPAVWAGLVLAAVGLAASPVIRPALSLSPAEMAVTVLVLAMAQPTGAAYGLLQGQGRLVELGAIQMVGSITRLGIGLCLAAGGLGAAGAGAGVVAGYVPALAIGLTRAARCPAPSAPQAAMAHNPPSRLVHTAVAAACAGAPTALDMLLARHYLSADASGVYAAAMAAVRLGIFVALPVPHVLVPWAASSRARDKATSVAILAAAGGSAIIGAVATLLAWAASALLGWPPQLVGTHADLRPWASLMAAATAAATCQSYLWAVSGSCRADMALMALSPISLGAAVSLEHGTAVAALRAAASAMTLSSVAMAIWGEAHRQRCRGIQPGRP